MGLFDLPGFEDFIGGLDGQIVAGDCIGVYDEEHKRKVKELMDKDERYFHLIQIRLGLDPNDESYYGPDSDLRFINVDHFAIKGKLKNRLEEFRSLVYKVIDEVYELQDEIDLDEEVWPIVDEDDYR